MITHGSCGHGAVFLPCVWLAVVACAEPPGRWTGTEWWATYYALPEWEMTPMSAGAFDQMIQPFPSRQEVSLSISGSIAIALDEIPAVWIYDEDGRARGRAGRSEIMDLHGPRRTRIWAERAGWLEDDRLWIAERGGDVAVFNRHLGFSDVWEIVEEGQPLVVTEGPEGMTALLLQREGVGSVLRRVTTFRLPRAPEGTRDPENGLLQRAVQYLFIDDEGRTWLGLAEDDSGRAYWVVLDVEGSPIGRFDLAGGQVGLLAVDGLFWARRESDGVHWLHRYRFAAP